MKLSFLNFFNLFNYISKYFTFSFLKVLEKSEISIV
jgi:hypothetical protein